jgi:transposase InsO family protein
MIIKLGDDHQVQAKKKGSVRLGGVDIEAFFVPEFRISLLSVGQLDSQGYTTTFRSGICSIADAKGQKVLGANLEDGLYTLSTDGSAHISEIKMLRTASHSHSINMWHRRLAHLNHQDLRRLLESSGERFTDPDIEPAMDPMDVEPAMDPMDIEPVTDLLGVEPPITVDPVEKPDRPRWETPRLCSTCIHTKQQQHVIRTKAFWTSTPFELVHSDLCGPMKHSIGGAQYYIIYIDDCTRYTEVYFLITKTAEEISAKFQHYQAWVETQGFHIKRFRSDNGSGEYNNSTFLGFLGEKGITFEPSPPYTQHKNGTAERMIRTLNAKARSMMLDANVPIIFWPEAIRTACYLHRRSPTSSLTDNRSPYEALYGTIPKIGHLRRFGCRVYKHIPPAQRTEKKFGNRSSMCMMLGYVHNTMKIWRIWDFKSGKTGRAVECSSVVFDEEENAHTEEQTEAIEFPNTTNEAQIEEAQTDRALQDEIHEIHDTQGPENTSK